MPAGRRARPGHLRGHRALAFRKRERAPERGPLKSQRGGRVATVARIAIVALLACAACEEAHPPSRDGPGLDVSPILEGSARQSVACRDHFSAQCDRLSVLGEQYLVDLGPSFAK